MTLAFNTKKPVNYITAGILLVLCVVMVLVLKAQFKTMETKETIYYGKNSNVTAVHRLSEWNENLTTTRNGAGDTLVYELTGEEEGDTLIIFGGVHANEPAGVISATWLVENLHPKAGKVLIMTHTNQAGYTCTDPQEGSPMFYTVDTDGDDTTTADQRQFRFGSRVSNPIYQWPDPDIYVHSSGMKLAGAETRNLNRCYPGIKDGTLTEQIAYALTEMVKDVDAAMVIDLHEASPEYKTINTTVYHSRAEDVAGYAVSWNIPDDMVADSGKMGGDIAPESLRGLSHIELGTWTDTLALLMETSNPSQGREHGKTGTALVVTGTDKFYVRNQENVGLWDLTYGQDVLTEDKTELAEGVTEVDGNLYTDANGEEVDLRALEQRVARHVTFIVALADAYNEEIGAAKEAAAAATTDDERAAIYEAYGLGYSTVPETNSEGETYKYYGQIIGDRRTGKLDLGISLTGDDAEGFYTQIKEGVYEALAPDDIVLNSDELWEMDADQFPVSIVDGQVVPSNN